MHPNFRTENGETRLLALWDQRGPAQDGSNRYGYGTIHTREAINRALESPDPYATLGYTLQSKHPSHGTCVMDIAAGNGRLPGTIPGLAPCADLVFVDLAAGNTRRSGISVTRRGSSEWDRFCPRGRW